MDKRKWPTGIRPTANGEGLQIRIWRDRAIIFQETLPGDPFNPRNLAAAKQRRRKYEARLNLGLPIHPGDTGAKTETVAMMFQTFLDTLDADDSTHLGYENIFNCYWAPLIGDWPKDQVTQKEIKEQLAKLKRKDGRALSPKTKRNVLGPLSESFKEAGISPNPAEGIKIRRGQRPKVERYKPEQRDQLLRALTDPEDQLYFAMLFGCGLRPRGEPLALQWSDYNGEEVDISKQMTKRKLKMTTKTCQIRTTYVPPWVRPLLNNYPTRFKGEFIFQNAQGEPHRDADKFIKAWREAHKKCRIPYRTPYKCRHTRASEMLSQGVEPAAVAKQLGHSIEMTFRIYADWIEEFSKNRDRTIYDGVAPVLTKPLAN